LTYNNLPTRRHLLAGIGAASVLGACGHRTQKFDADIIVLGAGLSGLYAAHLLADEGKDVLVLEASSHVGGRLKTIKHNGYYSEAGGEQIGAGYARIRHMADRFGVTLSPSASGRRQTTHRYAGNNFSPDDWKANAAHPFPGKFKGMSPGSPLFRLAAQYNPLKSASDWRESSFVDFDMSAEEFLTRNEFNNAARTMINQTLNANDLESYSMMNVYRSMYLFGQSRQMGPNLYVEGGADHLTKRMSTGLNVRLGQTVQAITANKQSVEIQTQDRTYKAATCICSLPFGALRHINVDAPLSPSQTQAVKNMAYTQILQIHFETESAYWDVDGLPADMWTDEPIERIFANRNLSGDYTGLNRIWINGAGVNDVNQMDDPSIGRWSQDQINRIRPSIGNINVYHVQRWTSDNNFAGGAYMHWAPGQITKWANGLSAPAGNLYFCGEHLSHLHTGMEGAMESAESAAFRLLEI
jgi:monoamine oxidase